MNIQEAETLKIKYGLTADGETKHNLTKIIKPIINQLVFQIEKYINFYYGHISHDYLPAEEKIEKIILCGGGANLKNLTSFLSKELKTPVEAGNPFLHLLPSNKKNSCTIPDDKALAFTTAIGLAMRGASENF